jgi:hypothetical protein
VQFFVTALLVANLKSHCPKAWQDRGIRKQHDPEIEDGKDFAIRLVQKLDANGDKQ